jgi:hypothetical protein
LKNGVGEKTKFECILVSRRLEWRGICWQREFALSDDQCSFCGDMEMVHTFHCVILPR